MMKKGWIYLLIALLTICCATDRVNAEEEEMTARSETTAQQSVDPAAKSSSTSQKDAEMSSCLQPKDSVVVREFLEVIALSVAKNDELTLSSSVDKSLRSSDRGSKEDGSDHMTMIRDYLLDEQIAPDLKEEMIVSRQMVENKATGCYRYEILRDFSISEYSIAFTLEKNEGRILITKIELIG